MNFKRTFYLFLVFIQCSLCLENLCDNKLNNKCLCRRIVKDDNFPATVVDCSQIDLDSFPDKSQLVEDINELDLSMNKLYHLDSHNLNGETITILKLSYNAIQTIDKTFFDKTPYLEHLYLDHNKITLFETDVIQNLKNLRHIDLSFNNLKRLGFNFFGSMPNLKYLDLSYNDDLATLWMNTSQTFLSTNLGISQNLTHLKLDHVGLTKFTNKFFDGYDNLKHLSIADNAFSDFPNMPYSVEYLDVSGSGIKEVHAKHLPYHALKVLRMNRLGNLYDIHHYAFYNLQSLEELYLSNNYYLTDFNELVFGGITKDVKLPLKKMTLASNSLMTLNYTFKYLFRQMEFVDLSNNPWECDCDLIWTKEFHGFFRNPSHFRCSSPGNLYYRLITELKEEDLPDCHPEKYGKRAHRIIIPILTILIIILIAIVGYLIYYAPKWRSRSNGNNIGPQSPYNIS